MTRNYNRTGIFNFYELSQYQQAEILQDMEIAEAEGKSYVILKEDEEETALPLDMFIRTDGNFTHGIFSLSYFSGYYLTLSRCGTEGVIAYKYF
jgi:hypothetical protein